MRAKLVRAATVAVALGAVTVVSGCTSSQGVGGDSGGGTIRVVGTADTQAAVEQLVASFTDANPDIEVTTTFTPTDAYISSTPRTLGGSNSPDVAIVFPGPSESMQAIGLLNADLIVDQSESDFLKNLSPAQLPLLGADGQVGFNPLGFDTIGIIYNEQVFNDNGIQPATTFTELKDLCGKLNAAGITPISQGLGTSAVPQFMNYALVASTVYVENPEFDTQQATGDVTFADSGWVEALDKQLELRDAGCFGDDYLGTTYEQMLTNVATGQAAMTVTVGPSFASIREQNPDGTFAMFPMPAYDDVEKNGAPQALSVGFGISAKSSNPDGAQTFVDFANQPENAIAFAGALGVNPIDPSAPAAEGFGLMLELIKTGRTGPFVNQWWPSAEIGDVQTAITQGIFTGQNTVAEGLTQMDAAYDAASK